MKVTRITLDSELGLVELKTGPGGDGDYVLLPIDVPPTAERYLRLPGEPASDACPDGEVLMTNESPYSGIGESADEAKGVITAPGGWYVPKDQAYDFNTTPGLGAYDAEIANPPQAKRGGRKYPKAEEVTVELINLNGENVGTMKIPAEMVERERHTGPATVPNPITVIAHEHSRGYRLTCPSLPRWKEDINQYNLHLVPSLIRAGVKTHRGYEIDAYKVSIIIEEMK